MGDLRGELARWVGWSERPESDPDERPSGRDYVWLVLRIVIILTAADGISKLLDLEDDLGGFLVRLAFVGALALLLALGERAVMSVRARRRRVR